MKTSIGGEETNIKFRFFVQHSSEVLSTVSKLSAPFHATDA